MLASIHSLQPHLLSLLRIVSSLVLFSYGTQKILHFPAAASVPPAGSLSWIAGLLELTSASWCLSDSRPVSQPSCSPA